MRVIAIFSLAAAAVLAGCDRQAPREDPADNALIPSAETRTGGEEPDVPEDVATDEETAGGRAK